jgi:hypothetical protein
LCFFHLPRTGGTAVIKDVLFRNFFSWRTCHVNYDGELKPLHGAQDPLRWSGLRRASIRLLAGHMPFGLASRLPGCFDYVTFLRDPVARAVSDYYFCALNPSNPASAAAQRLSLIEYVEQNHGLSNNCYVRWLSNSLFGEVFPSDAEMMDTAFKNLSQFSFVGLTEQFDSSVERLCLKYGLVPYGRTEQNRNHATPRPTSLSDDELRVIQRHNSLDLALYQHICGDVRFRAAETFVLA